MDLLKMMGCKDEVLKRAKVLGWPAVGLAGLGIATEEAWARAVSRAFPIELADLTRQLDEIEARFSATAPDPEARFRDARKKMAMRDEFAAAERERDAAEAAAQEASARMEREAEAYRTELREIAERGGEA